MSSETTINALGYIGPNISPTMQMLMNIVVIEVEKPMMTCATSAIQELWIGQRDALDLRMSDCSSLPDCSIGIPKALIEGDEEQSAQRHR